MSKPKRAKPVKAWGIMRSNGQLFRKAWRSQYDACLWLSSPSDKVVRVVITPAKPKRRRP